MGDAYDEIAGMIDHSLLPPTLTVDELEAGCRMALEYRVASVCILPYYLPRCATILAGSGVRPSTTIGFPHGGHAMAIKLAEARQALDDGGEELDVVVNISKVLSGDWSYVRDEIRAITDATHEAGRKVKIIFENCYLNDDQKIHLCEICGSLDVDWIKTSTGFGPGGATPGDLRLMLTHAPRKLQVKASGGIRDLDTLLAFRALGVTRVGSSKSKDILDEYRQRFSG